MDGKIIILDDSDKWGNVLALLKVQDVRMYSLYNVTLFPINLNPFKIPYGLKPQIWIDFIIETFLQIYDSDLKKSEIQYFKSVVYDVYEKERVFPNRDSYFDESIVKNKDCYFNPEVFPDWNAEITWRYSKVTFHKICEYIECQEKNILKSDDNNNHDLLKKSLSCFARPYSIEYSLFSGESCFTDPNARGWGLGIDEYIKYENPILFCSCSGYGKKNLIIRFIEKLISGYCRHFLETEKFILITDLNNKIEVFSPYKVNGFEENICNILDKEICRKQRKEIHDIQFKIESLEEKLKKWRQNKE